MWGNWRAVRGLRWGLLAMLAGGAGTPAGAYLPQSWNGWHWARTGPLAIHLGDNVSSAWEPYFQSAATQWSQAANIDFLPTTGSSSAATCPPVFGTVQVCSGNYGATGWLGYAYVWTSGSYIVEATVKLNDYYFNEPQYNTVAWRQLVACQEIGHTLGLAHADVTRTNANLGTCMDYTNDPTGTKGTNGTLANTQPSTTDFDHLAAIYANLDSTQIATTKPGNLMVAADAYDLPGFDHDVEPHSVPEPSSWALMVAGFLVAGSRLRRRAGARAVAA